MFHEVARRSLEVFLFALLLGCSIWVFVLSAFSVPYGD